MCILCILMYVSVVQTIFICYQKPNHVCTCMYFICMQYSKAYKLIVWNIFVKYVSTIFFNLNLFLETLMANLKILNESICTLHANYISGNEKKMERMKEYGFWYV